ncbi:MAG: hypothetical protein KDJ39_06175 [Gammaproteobacteria bacterium]|nr:hypothetical protein [Gammaproteobacteria bacterium]MCP5298378.1 hypothetical protein [Chromatiaceae bacterium]
MGQWLPQRLWGLALAFAAALPAHAEPANQQVFFAEPISGRRVTEYQVDLTTMDDGRHNFSVPADCAAIERLLSDGGADRSRVVDRRLWHKAAEDCWFHGLLNRHTAATITDYVTSYDFMNARIRDLPIGMGCDSAEGQRLPCEALTDYGHGMIAFFPFLPILREGAAATHKTDGECALRDGLFFGRLYALPDGIRCDAGDGNPSLRLIAVDFADINGDGVLDAVLRFVPVGPGAARSPLILPLTRLSRDGPFTVPAVVPTASRQ